MRTGFHLSLKLTCESSNEQYKRRRNFKKLLKRKHFIKKVFKFYFLRPFPTFGDEFSSFIHSVFVWQSVGFRLLQKCCSLQPLENTLHEIDNQTTRLYNFLLEAWIGTTHSPLSSICFHSDASSTQVPKRSAIQLMLGPHVTQLQCFGGWLGMVTGLCFTKVLKGYALIREKK